MIFDTHAHYTDEAFDDDRQRLLEVLGKHKFRIVNIANDLMTSHLSIELASMYDHVYATVGIHPEDVDKAPFADLDVVRDLCKKRKVVAIGEIGLDYYWKEIDKERSRQFFVKQMELANELDMPVVIHSREACKDTYDILKQFPNVKGVMHCYSYSAEMAHEFVKLGYYLGIGGVCTFKNAKNVIEVIDQIDIKHLVVETDAPYLAPVPFRGKRNTSVNLTYVIEKIASIKGMDYTEVCNRTYENGLDLYRMR